MKTVDIEPSYGPYRSTIAPYLSELCETRRLLERSACRSWWEVATLELFGHPPQRVAGTLDCSADFNSEDGYRVDEQPLTRGDVNGLLDASPPSHDVNSVVLALKFSNQKLGELRLRLLPHMSLEPTYESALTELAFQCACAIQRLASQRWMAQAQLGAPCLIGSSQAMLSLDSQIEESCTDSGPVLLLGPNGNEALQTAMAIHYASGNAEQTFVKVDCATTLESPWRWVDRARGGTLFLYNTDYGTLADQQYLWLQLEQALGHSKPLQEDSTDLSVVTTHTYRWACRLMVVKAQHHGEPTDRTIPHGSWSKRDWQVITLPLLSQRAEDIPLLTRAVLDYHGHSAEHRMTDALQHWCSNYTWPGNASQLEWTVARMAVLSPGTPIGANDISLLSPRLLGNLETAYAPAEPPATKNQDSNAEPQPTDLSTNLVRPVEHWVRCVLEQDTQAFSQLHAGMARALQYLSMKFHESISAEELAEHAHVSASHLRLLFREGLGLSFKLFLQHVRIAQAKRLLLDSPQRRVTDVALSVGFSDFSHFQKCFRLIEGRTPSDLRRNNTLVPKSM